MALKDVAGVFSRQFIVGFFAPSFFAIIAGYLILGGALISSSSEGSVEAVELVVIGGGALLLALLLSGVHYPILRLVEGYPLEGLRDTKLVGWLYRWRIGRWQKRYGQLERVVSQPKASRKRTSAAQELARHFPPDAEQLLPTRFGNVVRSFERHPRSRYGLDGVTIWPRIEMLLADSEREVIQEGETDVALFINAMLFLPLVGMAFLVDAIADGLDFPRCLLYVLPPVVAFVAAWGAYRGAVAAASRWGQPVRAAFDLHRLELYKRLGVKVPTSPSGERETARSVNRLLLYGEPIPWELRTSGGDGDDESGG